MKKQLLFVTYPNDEMDEGLSYAVDLARTMNEGIAVLLVKKEKLMKKLEDMMAAVAFAEEGDDDTARGFMKGSATADEAGAEQNLLTIREKCRKAGVKVNIHTVSMDAVSAVRDFLKNTNGIDIILLSPSVTGEGNMSGGELKRLVKTASRPVVTMSRQAALPA